LNGWFSVHRRLKEVPTVLILDEIGKMELFSEAFKTAFLTRGLTIPMGFKWGTNFVCGKHSQRSKF
jgi:hypothetical protein